MLNLNAVEFHYQNAVSVLTLIVCICTTLAASMLQVSVGHLIITGVTNFP